MTQLPPLRRHVVVAFLAALLVTTIGLACGGPENRRGPVSPSAVGGPAAWADTANSESGGDMGVARFVAGAVPSNPFGDGIPVIGGRTEAAPNVVVFPNRAEILLFRQAQETKYQVGLRRGAVTSFINIEGQVVWVSEYLRYRIHLCSHAEAIVRVFRQIDGQGVQPICADTNEAVYPQRQDLVDFFVQLEVKYRDGLRAAPTTTFVDTEGNVIWPVEYIRYRTSNCSHALAQQKVFDQIDGHGVQPDCRPQLTFTAIADACRCIVGSIEVRINNTVVANMGCSETRTFSVTTSPFIVSACGSNGCFGGNTLGPFTSSTTRRFTC